MTDDEEAALRAELMKTTPIIKLEEREGAAAFSQIPTYRLALIAAKWIQMRDAGSDLARHVEHCGTGFSKPH